MKPRSKFLYSIANEPKFRLTAKVWKVQLKFPCGYCLEENVGNDKPASLAICQVLN